MPKRKTSDTVSELQARANKENPRTISEDQKRMLRKALEKFGDLGGIVFNRHTGNLVGGHQRVNEFQSMQSKAPVEITKTYERPTRTGTVAEGYVVVKGERFSYRIVHWSREDETLAMIAANQHGGEFEWEGVSRHLKALSAAGADLDLSGFPQHELDNLLKADWTPAAVGNLNGSEGGSIDKVFLTEEARGALDMAKVALEEPDDASAIAKVCHYFNRHREQKTPPEGGV